MKTLEITDVEKKGEVVKGGVALLEDGVSVESTAGEEKVISPTPTPTIREQRAAMQRELGSF